MASTLVVSKKKKKKHTVDCVHFSLFSFVLHFVLNSYQIRRERERQRSPKKVAHGLRFTTHNQTKKKKWKRVRLAAKHTHTEAIRSKQANALDRKPRLEKKIVGGQGNSDEYTLPMM